MSEDDNIDLNLSTDEFSQGNSPHVQLCKGSVTSSHLFQAPENRDPGNFHNYYLELGMWPDMSDQKTQEISEKYKILQEEHANNLVENERLEAKLKDLQTCENCENLMKERELTKKALEESVELSNILLKEIYRLDRLS